MRQELPAPMALFRLITGYYVSRSIHVAAELGIADLLSQAAMNSEELSAATGAHAPSLQRVVRLLVSTGVFAEDEEGKFKLTPLGECLRAEAPNSMHATALLFGGIAQEAWRDLLHSVRTGEPAFEQVFGMDTFAYMAKHPEEAANFDRAMGNFTSQIGAAVASVYSFSQFRTVIDVGGGSGALIAAILRSNPRLHGTLFDQPEVAGRAQTEIGKLGLSHRCNVIGGDFFREVPAGGDCYVLKHVIHDWDDERAVGILRSCHRAMETGARLLILESIYPPRIDQSDVSLGATSNDVNMLVCTGGRQRTEQEFRALFDASNFRLTAIIPTPARISVIESSRI
jgi:O-methyltransferase domain/Dimerisation domain